MTSEVYNSGRQRQVRRVVGDLVRGRELLLELVWKDLRARYRYAVLGFLWAVFEPLALMLVLTFVFTFVFAAKGNAVNAWEERPFAIVLLCGLVFWQYTATALNSATTSLVDNQSLVKKVCFPREVIPLAAICYPLVNLGIGCVVLFLLHIVFGGHLGLAQCWLVVVFGIQFMLVMGLALLFSCGHVLFRDVGSIVSMAIMFCFYASPVFYPIELVHKAVESGAAPGWLGVLYGLNPMAGLLSAYRQVLFEMRFPDLAYVLWPAAVAVAALGLGVTVFRRNAPTLSDYL